VQTQQSNVRYVCSAANSYSQKMYNWNTLNSKVCSRLNFVIPRTACDAAALAEPMAIERVLKLLRAKLEELDEGEGSQREGSVVRRPRCCSSAPLRGNRAPHARTLRGTAPWHQLDSMLGRPRCAVSRMQAACLTGIVCADADGTVRGTAAAKRRCRPRRAGAGTSTVIIGGSARAVRARGSCTCATCCGTCAGRWSSHRAAASCTCVAEQRAARIGRGAARPRPVLNSCDLSLPVEIAAKQQEASERGYLLSLSRLPVLRRSGGKCCHTSARACNLCKALLQILETKMQKLEQLVRLKDAKIKALTDQLQAAGLT
jgi:CH-like domain in sperm protein